MVPRCLLVEGSLFTKAQVKVVNHPRRPLKACLIVFPCVHPHANKPNSSPSVPAASVAALARRGLYRCSGAQCDV